MSRLLHSLGLGDDSHSHTNNANTSNINTNDPSNRKRTSSNLSSKRKTHNSSPVPSLSQQSFVNSILPGSLYSSAAHVASNANLNSISSTNASSNTNTNTSLNSNINSNINTTSTNNINNKNILNGQKKENTFSNLDQNKILNDSDANSLPINNIPTTSSQASKAKPLAQTSSISMNISLAEPVLFMQGFHESDWLGRPPAMLRGSLVVKVLKPTKIKAITLEFRGTSVTQWPEGIPPKRTEYSETKSITSHQWPFFLAHFPNAEYSSGADIYKPAVIFSNDHKSNSSNNMNNSNNSTTNGSRSTNINNSSTSTSSNSNSHSHHGIDLPSLASLNKSNNNSFSKDEIHDPNVNSKGHRTFQAGEYIYHFELPLPPSLPETINCMLGQVWYELEATIERPGAFRSNLVAHLPVYIVRTLVDNSLETSEPIAISRLWEDQLYYDVVIGTKAIPIGGSIPVAFKLTPLDKVRCHRLRILLTENTEYYCRHKKVHRIEPMRKVLIFEHKPPGGITDSFFDHSENINVNSSNSLNTSQNNTNNSNANNNSFNNIPSLSNNNASEEGIEATGSVEFEFQAPVPRVPETERKRLHPDTSYSNIKVHHWIKVLIRLSRKHPDDPTKRKHFEISIDSPFHLLSPECTLANVSLPSYTSVSSPMSEPFARRPSVFFAANMGPARPIHLIRRPSTNPPPFDAELPPPKFSDNDDPALSSAIVPEEIGSGDDAREPRSREELLAVGLSASRIRRNTNSGILSGRSPPNANSLVPIISPPPPYALVFDEASNNKKGSEPDSYFTRRTGNKTKDVQSFTNTNSTSNNSPDLNMNGNNAASSSTSRTPASDDPYNNLEALQRSTGPVSSSAIETGSIESLSDSDETDIGSMRHLREQMDSTSLNDSTSSFQTFNTNNNNVNDTEQITDGSPIRSNKKISTIGDKSISNVSSLSSSTLQNNTKHSLRHPQKQIFNAGSSSISDGSNSKLSNNSSKEHQHFPNQMERSHVQPQSQTQSDTLKQKDKSKDYSQLSSRQMHPRNTHVSRVDSMDITSSYHSEMESNSKPLSTPASSSLPRPKTQNKAQNPTGVRPDFAATSNLLLVPNRGMNNASPISTSSNSSTTESYLIGPSVMSDPHSNANLYSSVSTNSNPTNTTKLNDASESNPNVPSPLRNSSRSLSGATASVFATSTPTENEERNQGAAELYNPFMTKLNWSNNNPFAEFITSPSLSNGLKDNYTSSAITSANPTMIPAISGPGSQTNIEPNNINNFNSIQQQPMTSSLWNKDFSFGSPNVPNQNMNPLQNNIDIPYNNGSNYHGQSNNPWLGNPNVNLNSTVPTSPFINNGSDLSPKAFMSRKPQDLSKSPTSVYSPSASPHTQYNHS